jgi:formylmethanofuran dehydrogenase subunit E-like metal-binding protein
MRKSVFLFFCFCFFLLSQIPVMAKAPNYDQAVKLGKIVVKEAERMLKIDLSQKKIITLTNSGYAEPKGVSSRGCLDGIAQESTASIGSSTLLCLQSQSDRPLWFSFYAKQSGQCAYLQIEEKEAAVALKNGKKPDFELHQLATIKSEYLFAHPKEFIAESKKGLFGVNQFRVITVSNAAARDCPDYVLQAITRHDHYCPGIISGVLLAKYIQEKIIDPKQDGLFILSIKPWCKEDALTTLLNVTPGKRAYGVLYPDNTENWPKPLDKTCTIAFTQTGNDNWTGHLLGFNWPKNISKKDFNYTILDKLQADLWFLNHLNAPESFVLDQGQVKLPQGCSPKQLLKPSPELLQRLVPVENKS